VDLVVLVEIPSLHARSEPAAAAVAVPSVCMRKT
jgi:hypothetical protein